MREIRIKNEEDTKKFGRKLAEQLKPGDTLGLVGDLGTGKTTLTRSIAEGLGIKSNVTSPTFTIAKEYRQGRLPLFHMDVYRLKSSDDLFDSGIQEYFNAGGVCIIEWADLIAEILPDNTKVIFLEYGENEGERIYKCTF